eukprot:6270746-Prymnesium_polylepis.1
MHWRNACEIYGIERCVPKEWWLFNSGVMLLSRAAHLPALRGWERERLECRVLCDQLYFNALVRRGRLCLHDLGSAFNYVGSELRRALVAPSAAESRAPETARAAGRRATLRDACVLHLTRKVPKLYTADWVAQRALRTRDVLQCGANASWPRGRWRKELLAKMPPLAGKYDIGREMCDRQPAGCTPLPWVVRGRPSGGSEAAAAAAAGHESLTLREEAHRVGTALVHEAHVVRQRLVERPTRTPGKAYGFSGTAVVRAVRRLLRPAVLRVDPQPLAAPRAEGCTSRGA